LALTSGGHLCWIVFPGSTYRLKKIFNYVYKMFFNIYAM
jgi:hypothetical protein